MNLTIKISILDQIYKIYDQFVKNLDLTCKRYCAACCTRNVTLTSLEAYKIIEYMISHGHTDKLKNLRKESHKKRFQPKITTNQMATLYLQGQYPPDEENEESWGACPFLTDKECPIYSVRPFGCRCMISNQDCNKTGYANIAPFVVTVNYVMLQYIEHIDIPGYFGNLTDMLFFLESEDHRQDYRDRVLKKSNDGLLFNEPIKALLIPPEDRDRIEPILQSLKSIS